MNNTRCLMSRSFGKMGLSLALLFAVITMGCASFQTTSYQTLGTIATTVEAARAGFIAYANTCNCVTSNQLAQVSQVYLEYQTAMVAAQAAEAAAVAANNANDPAYQQALAAVSASAADIGTLIAQITTKK